MQLPPNLSVNADAQRVWAAARPTLGGRRLLLRYAALGIHCACLERT
jgi:hypothetical protein